LPKFYEYKNGELTKLACSPREWRIEIRHVFDEIEQGYWDQGYNTITAREACDRVLESSITIVIGETWIAGYQTVCPWHLMDSFLLEEFYGPRLGYKLDMASFIAGSCALGKLEGCRSFEFGTRSNKRHEALARLCRRHGAVISAITLQKEIPYGIR
jgi:hypothetical protein